MIAVRKLFSQSMVGVGVRVVGLGLNFFAFFFLLRILDKPDFGKFGVLWALAQLTAALSRGGLEKQFIRETGRIGRGPPEARETSLLAEINTLYLTIWGVVAIGIGAIGLFAYAFSAWEVTGVLIIGLVLGQVAILSSQLRVRNHVLAAQVVDGLLLPLLMFLMFLALFLVEWAGLFAGRAEGLFALQGLIVAGYVALGWGYGHRSDRLLLVLAHGIKPKIVSLKLAAVFSFAVVSTINIALNQTIFLVGGTVLTLSDLADYRVAIQFSSLVLLPLPIINLVAAPYLASLRAAGDAQAQKRHAFLSVLVISLLISVPIFAGVMLLAPQLVQFYGGEGYESATTLVRILSLGALVNTLTGPVGLMLLTFDDERQYALVGVFWLVLNVVGVFVLSKAFGIIGAATASAATIAFLNLTLLYFVITRHARPSSAA